MTKAKNAVFIGLQLENCCLVGGGWLLVGGIKVWWGESTVEGIFLAAGGGGGWGTSKFLTGGGIPLIIPSSRENPKWLSYDAHCALIYWIHPFLPTLASFSYEISPSHFVLILREPNSPEIRAGVLCYIMLHL